MNQFPLTQRAVALPECSKLVLHPLSDVHVGADRHRREPLEARLKFILKQGPEHRVICHGDWGDIRNKDGKSFAHGVATPDWEFDEVLSLLQPLAKANRIDLFMPGNHEDRIRKTVGFDWMGKLAAALGVYEKYSPGPAILTHSFAKGKMKVVGLIHHGFGGGKQAGSSVNNVTSMANWCPDVDYTLMGHVHQIAASKSVRYLGGAVHEIAHVITGTYVDWEHYAQTFGLHPSRVGTPTIYVGDWNIGSANGSLINVVI